MDIKLGLIAIAFAVAIGQILFNVGNEPIIPTSSFAYGHCETGTPSINSVDGMTIVQSDSYILFINEGHEDDFESKWLESQLKTSCK